MTLDEKLNIFYNSAIETATDQGNQMIEEYRQSLRETYERHKAEAERKMDAALKIETDHLIREKNKQISVKALEIRRGITDRIASMKESLFEEAAEKLRKYMETPEYKVLLARWINEAAALAKGDAITIYINPSDADKLNELEHLTGQRLTVSAMDFMGGIRSVIHERSILIDNSFATRLAEQKESYILE